MFSVYSGILICFALNFIFDRFDLTNLLRFVRHWNENPSIPFNFPFIPLWPIHASANWSISLDTGSSRVSTNKIFKWLWCSIFEKKKEKYSTESHSRFRYFNLIKMTFNFLWGALLVKRYSMWPATTRLCDWVLLNAMHHCPGYISLIHSLSEGIPSQLSQHLVP